MLILVTESKRTIIVKAIYRNLQEAHDRYKCLF